MDIFDGHYYKFSQKLLRTMGLWPNQNKYIKWIIIFIFYASNLSLTVPQLILLFEKWGKDMFIVFENNAAFFFACTYTIKFGVQHYTISKFKLLQKECASDWQRLSNTELEILTKHAEVGRILAIAYAAYLGMAWVAFAFLPLAPLFLDIIIPLNETRPHLKPFYADYVFFKQDDYHYWACLHGTTVYLTSILLIASTDGMLMVFANHVCGLFNIVCHRIREFKASEKPRNIYLSTTNSSVEKKFSNIISLHNKCIRCCTLIRESFCACFMVTQTLCMIILALGGNYFIILQADTIQNLRIAGFILGVLIHLFFTNLTGQLIIDNSIKVYYAAYNCKWYEFPTKYRKSIILLLARSMKPYELTSGKVTSLSLKNFGQVIRRALSICTAILSFREQIIEKLNHHQEH